jgi:hypothetical protein
MLLSLAVNLFPQATNLNINNICVRLIADSPDLIENHSSRYDPACISAEELQQEKLLGRQLQYLTRSGSFAAKQIEFQIEDREAGGFVA